MLASLLLFALFETFPGLLERLHLEPIRYFGLRSRYEPDADLVCVPRRSGFSRSGRTRGNLYSAEYGVDVPAWEFHASFTERGFRRNGASPPYDVLVIGDSYVVSGETDADTLSERLRAASGLRTFNLGRGWYGPPQYVELLRRFGPELKPRYALFCFFDGNDMEDVRQYRRWEQGGGYYDFAAIEGSFLRRYWTAVGDTARFLWNRRGGLRDRLSPPDWSLRRTASRRIGVLQVEGDRVPVRFGYITPAASQADLLATEEWRTLRSLLASFRALCLEQGTVPLIVYIPTKFQVHAAFLTPESGAGFLELVEERRRFDGASARALAEVAADLGIEALDLTPAFRRHAAHGKLLYYPFDTHWNSLGRQVAAEEIAHLLEQGRPGGQRR